MTAVLVGNRKGGLPGLPFEDRQNASNWTHTITCRPDAETETTILFLLASLGILANSVLMVTIILKSRLRRWSQGLVFHQAIVDLLRSTLLLPLGESILACEPITKCSLLETSFLVLVTASTINLLTTVLNDAPVLPEDTEEDAIPILMDSPQCVFFGIFIIWFASITINLGPTFLSGTMAANSNFRQREPSCPLVQGPYRHYILNFLWISINLICILLTMYHLVKLYRDFSRTSEDAVRVATLVTSILQSEDAPTGGKEPNGNIPQVEDPSPSYLDSPNKPRVLYADPGKVKLYLHKMEREGIERVKMFLIITLAYLIFWGPLFTVTLLNWDWEFEEAKQSMAHEVTLHVAFVHSFVNPALFMVLHRNLRQSAIEILCCPCACARKNNLKKMLGRNESEPHTTVVISSENKAFLKHRASEDGEQLGL